MIRNGNAKSKRYDWLKDPNGYLLEGGRVPTGRCFHCGSLFANPTPYSAFCRVCWFDMKLDSQEPKPGFWEMQRTHIRLSDNNNTPGDFKRGDGLNL